MKLALLSIWRPEAVDLTATYYRHDPEDPFEGIEVYVMDSEETALALANKLADENPRWKFHVETASKWERG